VLKAGDAADDRERPMSDVPNLGKKFRGPMPMFSCLSSDTEQTSVTSRLGISRLGQSPRAGSGAVSKSVICACDSLVDFGAV